MIRAALQTRLDNAGSVAAPATRPTRGALALGLVTLYLVWGSTYLAIGVAVESVPPFLLPGARFLLAGAVLFAWARLRGAPAPTWEQWRSHAVVGVLLLLGGNGLLVWAQQEIPSGVAALLFAVVPLFVVLVDWAWPGGVRPSGTILVALVAGFLGTAWVAAPGAGDGLDGRLSIPAVAAVLVACAFWALGSIYSRHARSPAGPIVASALQMLTGGAALMLVAAAHGDFARIAVVEIPTRAWLAFAYLVGAGSLIGFSVFVWLMKHSTPARVATFAYVNPVVALFLGWALADETISARTLAGSVVILGAVAVIVRNNGPRKEIHHDCTTLARNDAHRRCGALPGVSE